MNQLIMNSPSQSTHRHSFLSNLSEDIRGLEVEEGLQFYHAATRVLLKWLGYDLEDVTFLDSKDRGIDAWLPTESGLDIFQIKLHMPNENGSLNLSSFDAEGVHDLARTKTFLTHENLAQVNNKKLQALLHYWSSTIRSHKLQGGDVAVPITLHLVILGDELTPDAYAEFKAFQASNVSAISLDEITIQFNAVLHSANDIIDGKWRENNREWRDSKGKAYETIKLRTGQEGAISDNKNAVFYCAAIDLVQAYEALGYQLFEPNVRANIKASRVNQAIRDSVTRQRTRRDFRFLNNGVTMICDSFTKPNMINNSQNKSSQQPYQFIIHHPGVVNGLQTVVALHTAYQQLTSQDKDDFEANCRVLVRILNKNAVDDVTQVVKATNNQNPMKPRNLVSNNTEQMIYAQLFADNLGWFYEAKEGAWDAFDKDSKRWRPQLKKTPKDFRVLSGRKVRRIDNAELAQTWLSFIGFSGEAVNDKKSLFDDKYYSLIFKKQTQRHGFDYNFIEKPASDEALDQSPSAELMLVSFLSRIFASEMALTRSQNVEESCKRLKIDPVKMTKISRCSELS